MTSGALASFSQLPYLPLPPWATSDGWRRCCGHCRGRLQAILDGAAVAVCVPAYGAAAESVLGLARAFFAGKPGMMAPTTQEIDLDVDLMTLSSCASEISPTASLHSCSLIFVGEGGSGDVSEAWASFERPVQNICGASIHPLLFSGSSPPPPSLVSSPSTKGPWLDVANTHLSCMPSASFPHLGASFLQLRPTVSMSLPKNMPSLSGSKSHDLPTPLPSRSLGLAARCVVCGFRLLLSRVPLWWR